ncbi:uncharacterized protein LOC132194923 [Neocloeon triangulifer]|uniref:uncharacterized protein LOC132194923 n=1 Tax=Neocloeon triangulifer TaxID=2078957 RepID=UPI00286EC77C|nr:uncharacterized protein LOC132194923 [Neocloeon triangulifer]
MFSALARNTLRAAGSPASKVIARNINSSYTVVSGPPTNRISFAEKLILGMTMCGSLFVVPSWVLVNIKKWNGSDE